MELRDGDAVVVYYSLCSQHLQHKHDKCCSNRNLQLWNWETVMLWWYITHCAHNTCNINMTNAVLTETFNYGTERRWCCGGILLIVRTTPTTKYDKCSSNRNLQLWNWETVMLWWYITHCAHNTCNINMTNAVLTETFNYGTKRRWCCGGILLIVLTTPAT